MARPARRRSFDLRSTLLLAVLVVVGVVGVGLLGSSLGWFEGSDSGVLTAPPGTIAVPAAGTDIPAYTQIRLEHLIDPQTLDLRAVFLPEGSILPETFVDATEIVGRVLAVDKRNGQLFSKADFYPPGTREGIVAGIPAGKRAMRIEAGKVNGIVGLARGDRFDLVATLDLSKATGGSVQLQGAAQGGFGPLGSRMRATTIVAGGAVVQPLETRSVAGSKGKVVEEMVIAVAPEEVASLTEALHNQARVDCVPISGQPTEVAKTPSNGTPSRSRSSLSMVETIVGGQRKVIAVRSDTPEATALPSVSTAPPPSNGVPGQGGR